MKGREQFGGYFDKLEVFTSYTPDEVCYGLELMGNWIRNFKAVSNYCLQPRGYKRL